MDKQDCKRVYDKLLEEEPYYTKVPEAFYTVNNMISSLDYVKRKMKVTNITSKILLQACEEHVEIFSYYMLGINLRPYQHYALVTMDKHNDVAMTWSRRTGKSTVTKIYCLWTSIFNKLPGTMTGTTWNIILQDQDIANSLYIEPLHEMMEKGNKIITNNFKRSLGETWLTDHLVTKRDKFGKVRSNQITFKTSSGICRINTMPPTNKVIGREGNLIGDEVSKWKDNPKCKDEFKFYDQLIAIKKDQPDYKAIFLTTPEGPQDLYATTIFDHENTDPNNPYHKLWYPWQVRQDPQWHEEMRKTKAKAAKENRLPIYQQEFEAKFTQISEPFIPTQYIQNCTTENILQNTEHHTPCSLGIDWGGTAKSETSITITKWTTNKNHPRTIIYTKTFPVGDDLEQLQPELNQIKKRYNIKWVIPDNKGARWMIPQLEKQFGHTRVHPFNFTTDKKTGYEKLRQALQNKTLQLPNNTKLINQLANLNDQLKPAHANQKDDLADSTMLSIQPLYPQTTKTFTIHQY